jgi:hypothetical protein
VIRLPDLNKTSARLVTQRPDRHMTANLPRSGTMQTMMTMIVHSVLKWKSKMAPEPQKPLLKVWLDEEQDKNLFKQLAAIRGVTMSVFLKRLVVATIKHYRLTGRYLDEEVGHPTRIQDFLVGVDLVGLAKEISLPIENLEAILAGRRPSNEELIALSAAPCVTVDIEELEDMRERQFDSEFNKEPNGVYERG